MHSLRQSCYNCTEDACLNIHYQSSDSLLFISWHLPGEYQLKHIYHQKIHFESRAYNASLPLFSRREPYSGTGIFFGLWISYLVTKFFRFRYLRNPRSGTSLHPITRESYPWDACLISCRCICWFLFQIGRSRRSLCIQWAALQGSRHYESNQHQETRATGGEVRDQGCK